MRRHIIFSFSASRAAQFCGGVLAVLLLVGCSSNASRQTEKAHEAAVYNVQPGLAYLCENGRYDEGVKRFLEAAHNPLYPTPEAAYTNAGVCLRAAKRDDEARANMRALQLKPNFAEAQFQLANLQFEHAEFASARAGIDSFIGTYNATADLLPLGVRVARAQGDRVGAQRYARKLQLDFPGTDQARALAQLDHAG
jgi:type IV pilus assembly protein PilF